MESDPTASANGHPRVAAPRSGSRTKPESRLADGELVELVIALDTRAPGAARDFVVACLEQRVAAPALDSAQLLVSELVTNSFQHGGAPMDEVIVSV